jgi:hypothetical protein
MLLIPAEFKTAIKRMRLTFIFKIYALIFSQSSIKSYSHQKKKLKNIYSFAISMIIRKYKNIAICTKLFAA